MYVLRFAKREAAPAAAQRRPRIRGRHGVAALVDVARFLPLRGRARKRGYSSALNTPPATCPMVSFDAWPLSPAPADHLTRATSIRSADYHARRIVSAHGWQEARSHFT